MAINNIRTEPGVFSQFQPVRTFPVTPGGARVVALIGKGKVTNRANGEVITKGALDAADTLANLAVALESTVVDEDLNTYKITDDYILTGGAVAWSPNTPSTLTGTVVENYDMTGSVILKITVADSAAITATGIVTVVDYTSLGGAVLTVNGKDLTEGVEWAAATSNDATATDLASAITTATATTLSTGVATLAVITVTANTAGTVGNSITLETSDAVNLTVSDTTLTGGVDVGGEQVVDIGDAGVGSGQYSSPAAATATEVAAVIDANFTGLDSALDVDKVKITTQNGNNTSLLFGDGAANVTLGFADGTFLQTPKEPAPGKTYQVSYDYAKVVGDYVPRFFFTQSSVIDEHGDVSAVNTLSHGAEIVFQQGASIVALIQCDPADGAELTQFRNALTKLENVEGINIVVPLTTDENLYADVVSHVNNMSSTVERKERTAILAMAHPQTPQQIATQAEAIANKRIVLHNITEADRFIGNDLVVSTLDGSFVSAALAGIRVSPAFDVADPLTRKDLAGFNEIRPNNLLRSERVFMLDKGVCVINEESGINRVVQGITTDTSTVENQEYSVVEIIDFVGSNMRRVLESIYVGQKILTGTTSQVKSTVQAVLGNLVTSEIITAFQSVQASINITDPTQIDVSFEIAPVFPLNYILITFSLAPNQ